MMKTLWIIQHQDQTTAGTTLHWAENRGIDVKFWRPDRDPAPPTLHELAHDEAGVVICGGTMDTFEEELYPWLKTEKFFLRELLRAEVKCFGLCLGAQLLAEVLGGKVVAQKDWELGFVTVNEHLAAASSPATRPLSVFEWHHCTFEIPDSAELFVVGAFFPNQAFRVGDHVVGTQFHPEATEAWIRECAGRLRPDHVGNVQAKAELLTSLTSDLPGLQRWYFHQLDQFFLPTAK